MTDFCTPEVKKFMMDKADNHRGKGFFFMQKAWKQAVAMALLGTVACAPLALAEKPIPSILYRVHQDPMFDPAYTLAQDAMAELYKGSEYEKGRPDAVNPFISLAQVDLNGDRMDEIIASPVISYPESVNLCTPKNHICPFYILEVRGDKVVNLGVIKAATIDLGEDIQNGYWTINVYQRDAKGNYTKPDLYAYNKTNDRFERWQASPSTAPPAAVPKAQP